MGISPAWVRSCNDLTGRWCRTLDSGDSVVSAAGVWPLLAVLAGTAEGRVRAELAEALRLPVTQAHAAGLAMLASLEAAAGVSTAIGAWVRPGLTVREEWVSTLPPGTVAPLGDPAELDRWAREKSGGLIEHFPVAVGPTTMFALATALLAHTRWTTPFTEIAYTPATGPWQGRRGTGLHRSSAADGSVEILAEAVTRVVVNGRDDVDVHLLIGPGEPAEALVIGLAALVPGREVRSDLPVGTTAPCLAVSRRETASGRDSVSLTVPPFEIAGRHDLTRHAALFGLGTALDGGAGHFPGLSAEPLALDAAAQNVVARFGAAGFEAAAVSAVSMRSGRVARKGWSTVFEVRIDRPFGFLVVERSSGLALAAGQVSGPAVGAG